MSGITFDGHATEKVTKKSKLDERLDNLTPNDELYLSQKLEQIEEQKDQLLSETFDVEASIEHFDGVIPSDIKREVVDTMTNHRSKRSNSVNEDLTNGIIEDKLIADKFLKRNNKDFGLTKDGKQRRLEETDKRFVDSLLSSILRFLSPNDIRKELMVRQRKQLLKNVILDEETYSKYRFRFINEEYKNILGGLPKMLISEYGESYLREAFMVLHTLYKFGNETEILDVQTLAEIIVERNEVLPAVQMHQRPYTVDFFLELASHDVFKKIQKLCNDAILTSQIISLTQTISRNIDHIKSSETIEAKELKELTELLSKVQSMSASIASAQEIETISYVFNDGIPGMDYSDLAIVRQIDPTDQRKYDFKYYISCYDTNSEGQEIFAGWLVYDNMKDKWVSSTNTIHIFEVEHGNTSAEKEVISVFNAVKRHGNHAVYKLNKLVDKEHTLEEIIE